MQLLKIVAMAGAVLLAATAQTPACAQAVDAALSPNEARAIAKEATTYGFPLLDNYRVMHSYFVYRQGAGFKAPWNTLHNEARVYTPEDRTIQTPNSDTPYSQLGTDLRAEPLVLTVPAVGRERYYSLQFIDLTDRRFNRMRPSIAPRKRHQAG